MTLTPYKTGNSQHHQTVSIRTNFSRDTYRTIDSVKLGKEDNESSDQRDENDSSRTEHKLLVHFATEDPHDRRNNGDGDEHVADKRRSEREKQSVIGFVSESHLNIIGVEDIRHSDI